MGNVQINLETISGVLPLLGENVAIGEGKSKDGEGQDDELHGFNAKNHGQAQSCAQGKSSHDDQHQLNRQAGKVEPGSSFFWGGMS